MPMCVASCCCLRQSLDWCIAVECTEAWTTDMAFSSPFATPFARVSSMAEAIRRRKAQKESERVALAQLPRIRVGVCAMDKKVRGCIAEACLRRELRVCVPSIRPNA